jgi:hypothetical protein
MELLADQCDALGQYLGHFDGITGDQRTRHTLRQTVHGILGSQSLRCAQIARSAPGLAATDSGEQRVRDMLHGETTKNSPALDEKHVIQRLVQRGVEMLAGDDDIWVAMDTSDLRKPHATKMPDLMTVRDLDGGAVPGYRLITALGLGKTARGLLYHHLFSSKAATFVSEPQEVLTAIEAIGQALAPVPAVVTFLMDRGFDSIAIWHRIWQQNQHLVCRVRDLGRIVFRPVSDGAYERTAIQQVAPHLRPLASMQAKMEVRMIGQPRRYRQQVTAQVSSVKIQLRYEQVVEKKKHAFSRDVWIVHVQLQGTVHEPWWLITDWPVETEHDAQRIFRMYCARWAAEDGYRFLKECLGWEEVQLLDLAAIRLLVALAWVAAAFLYELGATWDTAEVQLLARLGGYVPHKGRKPGKIALSRGLQRLSDAMSTMAYLKQYKAEHGDLPPRIKAIIKEWLPLE